MKIEYILNEMLKKVEYTSVWVEATKIKELDNSTINRL